MQGQKKKPSCQNVNDKIDGMITEYIMLTEIPVQTKCQTGKRTIDCIRRGRVRLQGCGKLLKGQFRDVNPTVCKDIWLVI